MTKSRKKFDAPFKAKIALEGAARGCDGCGTGEAARGASEPDLCLEEAGSRQRREPSLFARRASGSGDGEEERERETAKRYAKIGQLTVERDFLARRPGR